jgi:hypothetical protein
MVTQLVLIVLALLITFYILRKRKHQTFTDKDEGDYQVKFDENRIELINPYGQHSDVLWQDLSVIAIKTTDEGPVQPDVFWQFYTGNEQPTLVFPQGTIGDEDLLTAMSKRLNGFNYQEVINAMGSTENALFVIWSNR